MSDVELNSFFYDDSHSNETECIVSPQRNSLPCPICLDRVTNKVLIGCGHVFCAECINHLSLINVTWDKIQCICCRNETEKAKIITLLLILKCVTDFISKTEIKYTVICRDKIT